MSYLTANNYLPGYPGLAPAIYIGKYPGVVPSGADSSAGTYLDHTGAWSVPPGVSSGVSQIIAGTNVTISPVGGTGNVTINASGGAGTVTNIATGTGLSGGPITTTGTISLASASTVNTYLGVTPSAVVASRTALRALSAMVAGSIVIEEGYAVLGDGGGGIWIVKRGDTTSVDNDGTIVVPGGTYGTTSTDMSFARASTLMAGGSLVMDVRWFGGNVSGYSGSCITPATHAFAALGGGPGRLHFGGGQYGFPTMLKINAGGIPVSITGDFGATELAFAFTGSTNLTTNYCMMQLQNFGAGSYIGNFLISNRPINANVTYPPSILRMTSGTNWRLSNVTFSNYMVGGATSTITYVQPTNGTQLPQGALWIEGANTLGVTVDHIVTGGFGPSLYVGGNSSASGATYNPSVILHHCQFNQNCTPVTGAFSGSVMGCAPTLWCENADSCAFNEVFVQNGGPYRYFQACSLTSSGGTQFTVTTPIAHNFVEGDYIVINGATNTGYNHKWRIHSVGSPTTFTVTSNPNSWTITGTEASIYVTSLFCCVLLGGGINTSGGGFTESTIRGLYLNTGGLLIEGSVGIYVCGRNSGNGGQYTNSGLIIAGLYDDFGETQVFFHGTASNGLVPGTVCHVLCSDIRGNGAPRSNFGMVRIEQAGDITINSPYAGAALTAYTGANITPNAGTGNWGSPLASPMAAIAICDGGGDNPATYGCMDISIVGGILQSVSGSNGISPLVSSAIILDGANSTKLKNIRARGSLYDPTSSNSTPITYLNGASSALIDNDL